MNVKGYVADEEIAAAGFLRKIGIQNYNIQKGNIHDLTGHDIIITIKEGTLFSEIKSVADISVLF